VGDHQRIPAAVCFCYFLGRVDGGMEM
jgi:hypothetical protein